MSVAALDRPLRRRSGRRLGRRLGRGLPSLLGLALLAALLPLRGNWTAGIVLLALTFTLPGVLALRALRVSGRAVRTYPLYIPAAALGVLLGSGLLADLVGPLIGIPRPMHGDTSALTVLGVSLVLWLLGLPVPAAGRIPWRRVLDSPTSLIPLALPLAAAAGALLLSHGDGATVARIGQGLVALVIFTGLVFAPRLSRAQLAMLLFACALAAEWAFSLRGQEVVGFDITSEIAIAQHIQRVGIWYSLHRGDAYGAMLSVTVLPSTLASLTGCSPLIAFKVVYPVLTALLPVSIFLLGEEFMRRRFAAGAAGLVLVQTYFFQLMPQLARQEIALIFFAALIAALIDGRMRQWPRLALIALLCTGLVVSHYSSTYLAVPIVVIALVVALLMARFRTTGMVARLLCASVVLVGGAFIWYGVVTHSSSNLTSLSSALEKNGLNLLPNSNGNIISSYLNGTQSREVKAGAYEPLAVQNYQGRAAYIHPLAAARKPRFNLTPATVPVPKARLALLSQILQWISVAFAELMLAFGVLGSLAMALRKRSPPVVRQIGVLAFSTIAILILIRFSGTIAAAYNQTRALAQSLLLLALPAAWLVQYALDRLGRMRRLRRLRAVPAVVLLLSFPVMFAYDSSLTALLTGGGTLLNLSSSGEDFQRQYMTPAELAGALWASTASQRRLLYADPYGQLRLNATSGAVALTQVTPETLDRHAWVYGTHSNVVLGTTRGQAGNDTALYVWPKAFLNDDFDTVYSDGDSKVYHR